MKAIFVGSNGMFGIELFREDFPKKSEIVKVYNTIHGTNYKAKDFKRMKKREIRKYVNYEKGQKVIGYSTEDGRIIVLLQ